MHEYEIAYVATNLIFTFSVYKLFQAFFGGEVFSRRLKIATYLLYFVISSSLVLIISVPLVTMIFNLIFLFIISLNYISSVQKKIIFSSLIYSILFVIEALVSISIGFTDISATDNSSFNSVIGLILIRTVTMIVAYLISRYVTAGKKDFPIHRIYYIAFATVLFGTLFLFAASLNEGIISIYNVLIGGAVLIIVNLTMIIIDEKIYNSLIAINEKNILKQQNIAYENQVEIINQSTEAIRQLKHDMENHLIMISEMYKNSKRDDIEPYIGRIIDSIDKSAFSKSNNFIVDSIINFKLNNLKDSDTKICVDVCVPQSINILAYDITVILGNLLDNAITAVRQSENKKLNLRVSSSMGNLFILIDNSYNGKLIIEKGKFRTTKSFKSGHGIGVLNIEKSLEKYGGEMRMEYTEDIFTVAVVIPYEK